MQLDSLVNCYNNTLSDLLDRHAPLKNRIVTSRTMVPWYNEEIKLAKKEGELSGNGGLQKPQ